MGGSKKYLESGGFTEQTYETIDIVNGIKIVGKIGANNANTPSFSNTPYAIYGKINDNDGEVNQVTVYGNRKSNNPRAKAKDIDSGHEHKNWKNGKVAKIFSENDIHVQEYDENGNRSDVARKPSKKERRLYYLARNKRNINRR